jgi:hypothetical protein
MDERDDSVDRDNGGSMATFSLVAVVVVVALIGLFVWQPWNPTSTSGTSGTTTGTSHGDDTNGAGAKSSTTHHDGGP